MPGLKFLYVVTTPGGVFLGECDNYEQRIGLHKNRVFKKNDAFFPELHDSIRLFGLKKTTFHLLYFSDGYERIGQPIFKVDYDPYFPDFQMTDKHCKILQQYDYANSMAITKDNLQNMLQDMLQDNDRDYLNSSLSFHIPLAKTYYNKYKEKKEQIKKDKQDSKENESWFVSCNEDGSSIIYWNDKKNCADALKCDVSGINKCLRGEAKQYKGYSFIWLERRIPK